MARSISTKEFEHLRHEVHVLIVTAMQVEADAVNEILDAQPFVEGVLPRYHEFRFGYFGEYLVAHLMCGQAGLRTTVAVTAALAELRGPDVARSFYVLMPGIACGLRRSAHDQTYIACTELRKYFHQNNSSLLPNEIAARLSASLETSEERIVLPGYMTPETNSVASTQYIGDILVASSLLQHNYRAIKPDSVEDRGQKFDAIGTRIQYVLDHAKDWQKNSPDANYGSRCCQVHLGPILSGDELLNHFNRRVELQNTYKDAIGLDMEGHGLGTSVLSYSTSERAGQAWFLFVKGICDWGVGKTDDWQQRASRASVSLLHHCLNDSNFFSGLIPSINKEFITAVFTDRHPTQHPLTSSSVSDKIGPDVLIPSDAALSAPHPLYSPVVPQRRPGDTTLPIATKSQILRNSIFTGCVGIGIIIVFFGGHAWSSKNDSTLQNTHQSSPSPQGSTQQLAKSTNNGPLVGISPHSPVSTLGPKSTRYHLNKSR